MILEAIEIMNDGGFSWERSLKLAVLKSKTVMLKIKGFLR
jgi:hypothetical protein